MAVCWMIVYATNFIFKQACCKKYYNIRVSATSVKYSIVVVITTDKRTQLLTILLMFAIV